MAAIDWKSKFRSKLMTAEDAVKIVEAGDRVFIGSACGTPRLLVQALADSRVEDVEIVHMLTLGKAPYTSGNLGQKFRTNVFFIGENLREAVQSGNADYTPVFLSEVPRLLRSGRMPIDVAMIMVTPPDASGFCSFGVSVDVTKPAAESARIVVAEVNPQMPRTLGDSFIHVSRIHTLVENDAPLIEYVSKGESPEARRIAKNVAELIEDGSTIQVGYGGIPSAVLKYLTSSKNLGVHTEVFSDSLIELIEAGVIDNSQKTIHPHKVVASFAMGTRKLYDYIDNNPMFEFRPADYTNDPFVISQNKKMVSINSALEVDLTGQVCADSIGTRLYSGIGGHTDFTRGAARSQGGKAIVALRSSRSTGKHSRIVSSLEQGSGVATSRGDVHYVVTEWGSAYLHGKSIRERTLALISIAHPDFRHGLFEAALERKYVPASQMSVSLVDSRYPEELESRVTLKNRQTALIRPIKPTDEPEMRNLFNSFSKEAVFYSFFSFLNTNEPEKASKFVNIDYEREMALVAVGKKDGEDRLIGAACYSVDRQTGMAEAAIVVDDDWMGQGVGSILGRTLVKIAKIKGVKGFVLYVLDTNTRAYRLVANCGYPIKARWEDGVYALTMRFDDGIKAS